MGLFADICVLKENVVPSQSKSLKLKNMLDLHREELMDNWLRAQRGGALEKIEPLK